MNKIEKAIEYATKAHEGQKRKWTGEDYIVHPLGVYEIAQKFTDNEDILAACILHDTVEDTDTSIAYIRDEFGEEVAYIVSLVTHGNKDWFQNRVDYLKRISTYDYACIVALADKIHNTQSLKDAIKSKKYDGKHNIERTIWFNLGVITAAEPSYLTDELRKLTHWLMSYEMAKKAGKASKKKRFEGKTKKEISEIMKSVRRGKKA